ncbi:hypothetical protein BKA70DRAFT_1213941 [Coprinopsis sp. MPI-PUGE-AT-0042]|nr:hypothetical protein BKA70DRAFT_1213941 [Coprinopsis sp. MPI-PUGE-AT-0042]
MERLAGLVEGAIMVVEGKGMDRPAPDRPVTSLEKGDDSCATGKLIVNSNSARRRPIGSRPSERRAALADTARQDSHEELPTERERGNNQLQLLRIQKALFAFAFDDGHERGAFLIRVSPSTRLPHLLRHQKDYMSKDGRGSAHETEERGGDATWRGIGAYLSIKADPYQEGPSFMSVIKSKSEKRFLDPKELLLLSMCYRFA